MVSKTIDIPMRTVIISQRQDFENLFEGFDKLKAISYVISPSLLLEFFDQNGYSEVEVLVGENLVDLYRRELEQKSIEDIERLVKRVEDGTLRIYIPNRTIHTKLYILEGSNGARVIISSANLTETARKASRQINYAWYVDLPTNDPLLDQFNQDYQAHLKKCTLFMDDLRKLLRERQDIGKHQVIEAWIKGSPPAEEQSSDVRRVLHEISLRALEPADLKVEPIIKVRLPEAPAVREHVEKFLKPLNPVKTQYELHLNGAAFIRHIEEKHRFPLMRVDLGKQQIWLGFNGSVSPMASPLPEANLVNDALQHIEDYINTVDLGQTLNPTLVKTSMSEALLYIFMSPFANEYMRERRAKFGSPGFRRGPRFLYIYGPARNGKSTFFHFALKLLTGHKIEPLPGEDFTKKNVLTVFSLGTVFPLVFDDVGIGQKRRSFERIVKDYWEVWWKEDCVSPQIILSTNNLVLEEWAKSRVKRVDFDVQFASSEHAREKLGRLFAAENRIFKWFSYLYLEHLVNEGFSKDDELGLARLVMMKLYDYAHRDLPQYFPRQPVETLYDPGRQEWRDILRREQAKIANRKGSMLVEFAQDMRTSEIGEYVSHLPQNIKCKRRGNTLIIQSPTEFTKWLDGNKPHRQSWFNRVKKICSF